MAIQENGDSIKWVYRTCEAEGCTVMIRHLPGQVSSRFCKWCCTRGITVEKYSVREDHTGLITKEEFGEALHEAIKLFAGRDQIRRYYKLACTKDGLTVAQRKKVLDEYKQREQDLTTQIEAIMPKLNADDVRRLLQRYEHTVEV